MKKKNVLVSLVSDQQVPNMQFIKEMEDWTDQYLFISTDKMESNKRRGFLMEALGISESENLDFIIVQEYSMQDIQDTIKNQIDKSHSYKVNITGGTKIMSMAVLELFKDLYAEIYYLTGKGDYLQLHPQDNNESKVLQSKINLEEYFTAYGFKIKNSKLPEPIRSLEENRQLVDYYLHRYDTEIDDTVLQTLRPFRNKPKKDKNISFDELEENQKIKGFLERILFKPSEDNYLNKAEVKYLTGEWFEEYLYQILKEEFKIGDSYIGMGWQVNKGVKEGIPNEFDVALMHNNKLFLFECKTSIYEDKERKRSFMSKTIYQSDSLRKNFGLFATTVIVTLDDLAESNLNNHIDRAEASNVKLIGRKEVSEGLVSALKAILK